MKPGGVHKHGIAVGFDELGSLHLASVDECSQNAYSAGKRTATNSDDVMHPPRQAPTTLPVHQH